MKLVSKKLSAPTAAAGHSGGTGQSACVRMTCANTQPSMSVTTTVVTPTDKDMISQRRSQWLRDAGAITSRVNRPTNASKRVA